MTDEVEARIARVIEEYDGQGWHRTGTAVDGLNARWFVETAAATGGQGEIEEFAFERLEPRVARFEADGRRIEGLPLFDAPDVPGGSVSGTFGPSGSGSPIGLVITRNPAPDAAYDAFRRDSGHRTLVAVTVGPSPGLQARNAGGFKAPFGVPVLQVGSENLEWLEAAADSRAQARLSVSSDRVPAQSSNVVVRVAGADPSLSPVVVSTPRTGWWACSGERGGGIGCWFELLRWATSEPQPRDILFVAFAGHELDHLGLDAFLERRPDVPAAAHAWLHFGANIGAARGASIRLSASRADDLVAAREALDAHGASGATSPDAGVVLGGESAVVAGMGARCVALLGGNSLFHYEADRWPANNDVPQIARQARAAVSILGRFAGVAG